MNLKCKLCVKQTVLHPLVSLISLFAVFMLRLEGTFFKGIVGGVFIVLQVLPFLP